MRREGPGDAGVCKCGALLEWTRVMRTRDAERDMVRTIGLEARCVKEPRRHGTVLLYEQPA